MFLLSRIGAAKEETNSGASGSGPSARVSLAFHKSARNFIADGFGLTHRAACSSLSRPFANAFCQDGTFNDGVSCTGAGAPVQDFELISATVMGSARQSSSRDEAKQGSCDTYCKALGTAIAN
jgi:hypothetical protein